MPDPEPTTRTIVMECSSKGQFQMVHTDLCAVGEFYAYFLSRFATTTAKIKVKKEFKVERYKLAV